MLYLIGGLSKSGKTYIAKRIMEEKHIPYFSTDFLLWSLGGDGGILNYFESDNVNSKIIEPYLYKILKFMFESNEDYIVEGTHITVDLVNKLKDKYNGLYKVIMIGYHSITPSFKLNEIKNNSNKLTNKWYLNIDEDKFKSILENNIKESIQLEAISKENDIKYFDIVNIEKEYNDITKYLFN